MTKDEIQTGILRVCKVANWDGDFNVVGFYALCDALVKLGAIEEREACAKVCDEEAKNNGNSEEWVYHTATGLAADIRARGQHD